MQTFFWERYCRMTLIPSPDNPRIKAEIEVNKAFDSGNVFSATPEKLVDYLKSLAIEDVPNTSVHTGKSFGRWLSIICSLFGLSKI